MRLLLVRHGETDWNKQRLIQGGQIDIDLNATGRRQVQLLGQALQDSKLSAVYASPLRRTQDTAKAIARWHTLNVVSDPALREIDAGSLNGAPVQQLADLITNFFVHNNDAGQFRMPGGESLAELAARTWGATQRILKQYQEGRVVAVSHHLAILTIICQALGLDLGYFRRLRLGVAAISILEFRDGKGSLVQLNDTCHLNELE